MARRIVDSAITGERFIFDDEWLDGQGRLRQLEYELQPGRRVPPHNHPGVAQSFEVISGRLHIISDGREQVLTAGQRAATAPGGMHAQWNDGPELVRVIEAYDPPVDLEPFFTVLPHALGSRNPLKIAVFFADFAAVAGPATISQRMMAGLAPLGRLMGFARWYAGLLPART